MSGFSEKLDTSDPKDPAVNPFVPVENQKHADDCQPGREAMREKHEFVSQFVAQTCGICGNGLEHPNHSRLSYREPCASCGASSKPGYYPVHAAGCPELHKPLAAVPQKPTCTGPSGDGRTCPVHGTAKYRTAATPVPETSSGAHALATEIVRISKYPQKYPLAMAPGFYILLGMAQNELADARDAALAAPVHESRAPTK